MSQRMILGREVTEDWEVRGPVGLPKRVLDRHLLVTGETGSGKTTTMTTGLVTGHQLTDGPTIVLDPKGTGWLYELARAHYARTGSLDDLYYVDVASAVPAVSWFDIRRDLEAGIDRSRAVQDTADHFLALLEHLKKPGQDAIRSPDVIRYFIRALFDPVHGDDAFPFESLVEAINRYRDAGTLPDVSDPVTEQLLDGIDTGSRSDVQTILQGVVTRTDKVYGDSYLRPLFNAVPADPDDAFAFDDWLDRDVFLLVDLSGPTDATQRVLANLLLTELWYALRRRDERSRHTSPPLALLCVDEVAHLQIDSPLEKFFSKGREYGLGVISLLQSPKQLQQPGQTSASTNTASRHELLQNTQNILAGGVSNDPALQTELSCSAMSEAEIGNRLGSLPPTFWLFRPAKIRGEGTIKPFYIKEPPLPPGDPDGPAPLSAAARQEFETALDERQRLTEREHCITYESTEHHATTVTTTAGDTRPENATRAALEAGGFMTTLPLCADLPGTAMYDPGPNALVCETCGANRQATFGNLLKTLECHGSIASVDREQLPPVQLGLTLTADEIAAAPVDLPLLCALQVIYNIAQRQYEPLEVDLVHDSPHEILGLFGFDAHDVQTLADEGLITIDSLRGYSYYTVTQTGRQLLRKPHRKAVEWGHTKGDNTETLLHKAMVEALCRYVEQEYEADDSSPITRVVPYFELQQCPTATTVDLDGGTRFDLVGLDADDRIRLIGEAERPNNDAAEAAVRDYDQISTVGPDHALWIVPTSSKGHEAVLTPLADPPEGMGEPRIDGYSEKTRISTLSSFDEPGMTGIFTLNEIRKQLPEPQLDSEVL